MDVYSVLCVGIALTIVSVKMKNCEICNHPEHEAGQCKQCNCGQSEMIKSQGRSYYAPAIGIFKGRNSGLLIKCSRNLDEIERY